MKMCKSRAGPGRLLRAAGLSWALIALMASTTVLARSQKPPVPPGRDPGGVAIAIVGGGVDYTLPEIAARLARDGEGEIIGWDFIDGDQRPFDPCPAGAQSSAACPTTLAKIVLRESGVATLVVARASSGTPQTMAQGLSMVAQTRARIVLVAAGGQDLSPVFINEAAARFPALLFIVAWRTHAARVDLPNTITVAAAGELEAGVVPQIVLPAGTGSAAIKASPPGFASALAAAGVAALAARLSAAAPDLEAARLKQRLMGQVESLAVAPSTGVVP